MIQRIKLHSDLVPSADFAKTAITGGAVTSHRGLGYASATVALAVGTFAQVALHASTVPAATFAKSAIDATHYAVLQTSSSVALLKPVPMGIMDLPGAIDAGHPIGPIGNHEWLNPNVDGVRIRISWADIETADNTYNWTLIDDCLDRATTANKFIGLSLPGGIKTPDWVIALGVETRVLTAPDEGTMCTPWDPVYKAKFQEFVTAFGNRYDSEPRLRYVILNGFQQTNECYLANQDPDAAFFDSSAIAHGFSAGGGLSAAMVAWVATAKDIIGTFMSAFPTTRLIITAARPMPNAYGGQDGMQALMDWGVATYPGHFGIMHSQLNATKDVGYWINAEIYANRLSTAVGQQFLINCTGTCNICRVSNCDGTSQGCGNYGPDPCLTGDQALSTSYDKALNIGAHYVETYETDLENSAYDSIIATKRAAILSQPHPASGTDPTTGYPGNKSPTVAYLVEVKILSAGPGLYTLTGGAANFAVPRTLLATRGSYALTGRPTTYARTRIMPGVFGQYVLTGRVSNLVRSRKLVTNFGSYILTGEPAIFRLARRLVGGFGAYVLTGQPTEFRLSNKLSASCGFYNLIGTTSSLRASRRLLASFGVYALSGQPILTVRVRKLVASCGIYVLTGFPIFSVAERRLIASTGFYNLIGLVTDLRWAHRMVARRGKYIYNGYAASFSKTRKIFADNGLYVLVGSAVSLREIQKLFAGPGTYVLTGLPINVSKGRGMSATRGLYILTGEPVGFLRDKGIFAVTGLYDLTGRAAELRHNWKLRALFGSYVLSGYPIASSLIRTLDASVGLYNVLGIPTGLFVGGRFFYYIDLTLKQNAPTLSSLRSLNAGSNLQHVSAKSNLQRLDP